MYTRALTHTHTYTHTHTHTHTHTYTRHLLSAQIIYGFFDLDQRWHALRELVVQLHLRVCVCTRARGVCVYVCMCVCVCVCVCACVCEREWTNTHTHDCTPSAAKTKINQLTKNKSNTFRIKKNKNFESNTISRRRAATLNPIPESLNPKTKTLESKP